MRKFKYVGECAQGFAEFTFPDGGSVRMPKGEAVEVPDDLARKLEKNSHFEEAKAAPEKKAKGEK